MASKWLEQVDRCGVRLTASLCLLKDDCEQVQVLRWLEQGLT